MGTNKALYKAACMSAIHDAYISAISSGRITMERYFKCGILRGYLYRVHFTGWVSFAFFYCDNLIAIITENRKIYEFVNMYRYSDEISNKIKSDLACYISTTYIQDYPMVIFPKSYE